MNYLLGWNGDNRIALQSLRTYLHDSGKFLQYSKQNVYLWIPCWFVYNDLSYNGRFAYDCSPNVVLPTMLVCLIVDLISPYVCSPNQPLTKRAFIANLTWPPQSMLPYLNLRGMSLSLTLQIVIRQPGIVGEASVRRTDIRQTVVGKTTLVEPSLDESTFSHLLLPVFPYRIMKVIIEVYEVHNLWNPKQSIIIHYNKPAPVSVWSLVGKKVDDRHCFLT